ncbi:MAG: sigma-70 family RNA polymerase sigma factor [Nitrospirota bacterium]|nr:sigma-70 family RNA polymerase sigma factor [Nitrospirota bacterium]
MELIKRGDDKAFELLLARHQRSVYNLACRFLNDEAEAEDITQETFIRVFRAAGTYTPEAKFSTWLYTIVKNLCFNSLRKRRSVTIVSTEEETLPEIPAENHDPSEIIDGKRLRFKVLNAVSALPENMRIAVILHKFHDLQYDEIAKILGCSVNAVKLRVHRAKALLANSLGDLHPKPNDA